MAAWMLVLAASLAPTAIAQDSLAARIGGARAHGGANPRQAVTQLQALRQEALAAGRLDARLAADEAECRLLTDLDAEAGLRVAEAGIAAAGPSPAPAARTAWLRLRACRAGVLLDIGRKDEGRPELEALLALGPDQAASSARGMALLERGAASSRLGDLEGGQRDLIEACELLRTEGPSPDAELCTFHLASHYRRVGDHEEALRLLQSLREQAGKRGAIYDDSVYVYTIATQQFTVGRWEESLQSYRQSLAVCEQIGRAHV